MIIKSIRKVCFLVVLPLAFPVLSHGDFTRNIAIRTIPFEVACSCVDKVGVEVCARMSKAVNKGYALYNDGVSKIYFRKATSSENRILMEFSCIKKEGLLFDASDISVRWFITNERGSRTFLNRAEYEQKGNIVSHRLGANELIRLTNDVLTANGILPE
jgi:hypothetical protein